MTEADGDANGRRRVGALWPPLQMHAGFGRRSASLSAVARDTARDDVFPVFSAALGDRHHMVEGQLRGRVPLAAVLARVVIPRVNVRARERHVVESPLDPYVPQQADDRRQLEAE